MKRRNIDKLSKDDIAKLSLIHSSIGTADSFDSWFEESIASKKTPRVLILIFIINYITLVFFYGGPINSIANTFNNRIFSSCDNIYFYNVINKKNTFFFLFKDQVKNLFFILIQFKN